MIEDGIEHVIDTVYCLRNIDYGWSDLSMRHRKSFLVQLKFLHRIIFTDQHFLRLLNSSKLQVSELRQFITCILLSNKVLSKSHKSGINRCLRTKSKMCRAMVWKSFASPALHQGKHTQLAHPHPPTTASNAPGVCSVYCRRPSLLSMAVLILY